MVGTTAAHAENTKITVTYYLPKRNYLRVRGEYGCLLEAHAILMELPPRARRIPQAQTTNLLLEGTTSACAENTREARSLATGNGNYLRVRGEYVRVLAG